MERQRKQAECTGECWAIGTAFRELDTPCAEGIGAAALAELIREAESHGKREATRSCAKGCTCAGRLRLTRIGMSPLQEGGRQRCVWFVAGPFEGTCERRGADDPAGPGEDELAQIRTRTESRPPAERPPGPCNDQPCRALASAYVTVKARRS